MSTQSRKKASRGRNNNRYNCNDNKNTFRNQDNSLNYSGERKKHVLSDLSTYTIARFLMGNEVQIITGHERYEGVLRTFDSTNLALSKVFVFDTGFNENIPIMKNQYEFKEILFKDILLIKMLNANGKLESVIIDQEISQRKQISKPNLSEDKNLVPYFDEDETHINEDEDDLNASLKGNCWYPPEDMLKVNEERFNVKNTFSETMEEYTTQIDKSDPHLKEKMEIAERLAKEIENDNNMKRGRIIDEDDDEEMDEELRFSAVIHPTAHTKPEAHVPVSIRLNPNAPEFRPRAKQPDEVPEPVEEVIENCQSLTLESAQHQQHQMMQGNRLSLPPFAMAPPQMNQQIHAAYQGQRIITNNWPVPIQAPGSGQYVLQPYQQVMPQHLLQQRQMVPEHIQTGSVFYQYPQFVISQDHSLSGVPDASHLYPSGMDTTNQINHTHSALHQLRQIPHIPILQSTNQISLHHQQQLQQQNPQQQQLNAYYQQTPHQQLIGQSINPGAANFQHLIMNQQQPQLTNGAAIQAFITNGRQ